MEPKIGNLHHRHERSLMLADFESVDFLLQNQDIALSLLINLDSTDENADEPIYGSKRNQYWALNDEENSQHCTDVGRLAQVSIGTSSTSACLTSVALWKKRKLFLNQELSRGMYTNCKKWTNLTPLQRAWSHILSHFCLFRWFITEPPRQNFRDWILFRACWYQRQLNLFCWHSSSATPCPALSKEAELFATAVALLRLRNQREIIFQILHKEVSVGLFTVNQALSQNLMNNTAFSIPESCTPSERKSI